MSDIFEAIAAGDLGRVTTIVEADAAALDARNEQGASPIVYAMYMRRADMLPPMLAHATRLDAFEAAAVGDAVRLTALIEADRALVDESTDGFTALHLAAYFGHEDAARTLLERGADPDPIARNPMQVRPLHSAVSSGQTRIAGMLVAAGANVNARQQGGWTPLHGAAHNGDLPMLELLLASGADPGAANDDGKTAIDLAREQGHPEIVAKLES